MERRRDAETSFGVEYTVRASGGFFSSFQDVRLWTDNKCVNCGFLWIDGSGVAVTRVADCIFFYFQMGIRV